MTQIVLSLPDKKVKGFLSFIHDLGYVKVEDAEFTVPAWQKKEVQKRIRKAKADPRQLLSSKEALGYLKSLRT